MANLTIRGIPEDVYEALKKSAESNRRSINNEVIVLIERAMKKRERDVQRILAEARELRKYTADSPVSDKEFTRMKNTGRP
jgi:hypothetical protein